MKKKTYIPNRNDIVFLDYEPKKGREIGKYRPALVLSSKLYNKKTGLVICCPISTSIKGGLTEVPVRNLERPSVVAASLVHTLSWKERKVKFVTHAEEEVMEAVLVRLLPLMGANVLFEK